MNVVHGLRMEALPDIAACSWCKRSTSKMMEIVFKVSVKLTSTDMLGCVNVEAAIFSSEVIRFYISSSSDFEHHRS